jgi:CheY-like chemotaxis protein
MISNSTILAVDRNQRNLELLSHLLNKEGYQTMTASSFEEFALPIAEVSSEQVLPATTD